MIRILFCAFLVAFCTACNGPAAKVPVPLTPDANTVLLMHFDEGYGPTTADVAQGLVGQLQNMNTVLNQSLEATFILPGYINNGISFMSQTSQVGVGGEFVSVTDNGSLNLNTNGGDLTIESWVRPTELGENFTANTLAMFGLNGVTQPAIIYLSKRTGLTTQQPYSLGIGNNGAIHFEAYYTGVGATEAVRTDTNCNNGVPSATAPTPIQLGVWQHIVVVRSHSGANEEVKIYYNGLILCDFTGANWGAPATNAEQLLIGYDNYYATNTSNSAGGPFNFAFQGQLDELKLENIAYTDAQVLYDFQLTSH